MRRPTSPLLAVVFLGLRSLNQPHPIYLATLLPHSHKHPLYLATRPSQARRSSADLRLPTLSHKLLRCLVVQQCLGARSSHNRLLSSVDQRPHRELRLHHNNRRSQTYLRDPVVFLETRQPSQRKEQTACSVNPRRSNNKPKPLRNSQTRSLRSYRPVGYGQRLSRFRVSWSACILIVTNHCGSAKECRAPDQDMLEQVESKQP